MFKWRQKINPPPVNSLLSYAGVINSDTWKQILDYNGGTMNVSFIVADDFSQSILFMDPDFVRQLSVRGFFFLDATFKIAPIFVGAYQVLTIISRKFNTVSHPHYMNFF